MHVSPIKLTEWKPILSGAYLHNHHIVIYGTSQETCVIRFSVVTDDCSVQAIFIPQPSSFVVLHDALQSLLLTFIMITFRKENGTAMDSSKDDQM
jgi:hypothetical protein